MSKPVRSVSPNQLYPELPAQNGSAPSNKNFSSALQAVFKEKNQTASFPRTPREIVCVHPLFKTRSLMSILVTYFDHLDNLAIESLDAHYDPKEAAQILYSNKNCMSFKDLRIASTLKLQESPITELNLSDFTEVYPQLDQIEAQKNHLENHLHNLSTICPHLTTFTFPKITKIANEVLKNIAEQCPHLIIVRVFVNSTVTPMGLINVIQHHPHVRIEILPN